MKDYLTEDEKKASAYNLKIALAILLSGAILSFLGGWVAILGLAVAVGALSFAIGSDNAFRRIDQLRMAEAQRIISPAAAPEVKTA